MGVNGDDAGTCKYTISISKYSCPMNCSNRGTCLTAANNTRTCDCYKVRSLCALGIPWPAHAAYIQLAKGALS